MVDFFSKNEKELETLIKTGRIYSHYIGMEFSIEMLIVKSEKTTNDGRNRNYQSQKKIRTLWEMETYKYSGILGADNIKHAEMKEKI